VEGRLRSVKLGAEFDLGIIALVPAGLCVSLSEEFRVLWSEGVAGGEGRPFYLDRRN